MTEHDDGIDPAAADRIAKNIDLAFRFLGEAIDDPTRLAEIPDGATGVVLPPDDPEPATENMGKAIRLHEGGRDVRMYRLGAPAGERAVFSYRSLTPRWPTVDIDPVAKYDRATDILVVDFFNGRRRGTVQVPAGEFGVIFVDPDTEEVIVNVLLGFLARAIRRDPSLIDVLLRPETTLRGVSRPDIVEMKRRLAGDRGWSDERPASSAALTERLELLTA